LSTWRFGVQATGRINNDMVQPSGEEMDLDHMKYLAEPEEALDRGGEEGI
jgi:hypothetical protein